MKQCFIFVCIYGIHESHAQFGTAVTALYLTILRLEGIAGRQRCAVLAMQSWMLLAFLQIHTVLTMRKIILYHALLNFVAHFKAQNQSLKQIKVHYNILSTNVLFLSKKILKNIILTTILGWRVGNFSQVKERFRSV